MTTEAFIPADDYVIAGVGPYPVPHEYDETSALVAEVLSGTFSQMLLEGVDYTVTPETGAASGSLHLDAAAAVAQAGKTLRITRRTVAEQGWAGGGGAREEGLEKQLDRMTRAIQDANRRNDYIAAQLRRTLRIPELLSTVSALPILALRAGKVLAFDYQGNPTAHEPLVAVIVDDTFIIGTALTAYLVTVDPAVEVIRTQGYAARGDGGGAEYVRADVEPSHTGKLQTADGQWWTLNEHVATPLMFGAAWNSITDDTVPINACASFCRATKRSMRLPPGGGYAEFTLWLGGIDITGAGNARAGGAEWAERSSSILWVAGGWGVIKGEPGFAKNSTGRWAHFEILSALTPGTLVSPLTLWDRASFPHQIGVAVGRNPLMLSSVSAIIDGAGFGTIQNVSIRGFDGWGLYGHMVWGLSLYENGTIHECGGPAAVSLGDMHGGGMFFDNCGVDSRLRDIHGVNWGYGASSPYARRGTFLRMGSRKADTDALGRAFSGGGNWNMSGCHAEGWRNTLAVLSSNDLKLDGFKFEGENIYLGDITNPADQGRTHMGRWSNVAPEVGFLTVHVANLGATDLGTYQGFQAAQSLIVKMKGTTRLRRAGGMVLRQNASPRARAVDPTVIIIPDWDATGAPGGSAGFIPWIDFDSAYLATEAQNLLPPIPDPTAAPYALTGAGTVKQRIDARTFRIARGMADLGEHAEVSAPLTGLLGAEVYSLAFRVQSFGSMLDWRLLEFGIRGDFEHEISRPMGNAVADFGGAQPGTVSIASGGTVVAGIDTLFRGRQADPEADPPVTALPALFPGTRIKIGGGWHVVAAVTSDTTLTLAAPYRGSTLSAAAWEWEGESRFTSRVCNFTAPPDGEIEVYFRSTDFNSAFIRDITVVRGFLVDFPIQK